MILFRLDTATETNNEYSSKSDKGQTIENGSQIVVHRTVGLLFRMHSVVRQLCVEAEIVFIYLFVLLMNTQQIWQANTWCI